LWIINLSREIFIAWSIWCQRTWTILSKALLVFRRVFAGREASSLWSMTITELFWVIQCASGNHDS
jgi:hypothetical protein